MHKDVAIIGGSIAGLFTAYLLAREGLCVRLFEAVKGMDASPRTLIVTDRIRYLPGSLLDGTVINEIRRFELFADGRVATISLMRPDLILERSKLIQRLAAQAEASGAEILTGRRFLTLNHDGKRFSFTLEGNGNIEAAAQSANVVVGADGTFSKVAACVGRPEHPTVALIQAVVPLPEDMPSDTVRVRFQPEDTPYFYWMIPHSHTHGVLGLIATDERQGRSCLTRVLNRKGLSPVEFQSARIPIYNRLTSFHRKAGKNDLYLVGDAAAHVKLSTVGGVVTGLRGAMGVAEAILNGGDSRELKALRRELSIHRLLRRGLHGFSQTDYSRLLDMLNPATKHLLSVFTRDELPKLLVNLFLRQPRLLFLGFRSFLR